MANLMLFKMNPSDGPCDWSQLNYHRVNQVFQLFKKNQTLHFSSIFDYGKNHFSGKDANVFWTSIECMQAILKVIERDRDNKTELKQMHILNTTSFFSLKRIEGLLEKNRYVVLSVAVCLGFERCDPSLAKDVRYLMKLPHFSGLIAGESKRSYYVFGCDKKSFYYLDPHDIIHELVAQIFIVSRG